MFPDKAINFYLPSRRGPGVSHIQCYHVQKDWVLLHEMDYAPLTRYVNQNKCVEQRGKYVCYCDLFLCEYVQKDQVFFNLCAI